MLIRGGDADSAGDHHQAGAGVQVDAEAAVGAIEPDRIAEVKSA
jgi:hypothetical protein